MVTAETALALPALVVVLAFAVTVQVTVATRSACVDAARAGARAAARGESDPAVVAVATRVLDRPARVSIDRHEGLVTVSVSSRPPSLVARLVPTRVEASSTAASESALATGSTEPSVAIP